MPSRVAVSGGFDPLHIGHLRHMQMAKRLGDELIVMLNPDEHMVKKKGYCFMPYEQREAIISELRCVDEVVKVIDDDCTVAKTLEMVRPDIFAKGGDRDSDANMPPNEVETCRKLGVKLEYGIGEKISSSSDLVRNLVEQLERKTGKP